MAGDEEVAAHALAELCHGNDRVTRSSGSPLQKRVMPMPPPSECGLVQQPFKERTLDPQALGPDHGPSPLRLHPSPKALSHNQIAHLDAAYQAHGRVLNPAVRFRLAEVTGLSLAEVDAWMHQRAREGDPRPLAQLAPPAQDEQGQQVPMQAQDAAQGHHHLSPVEPLAPVSAARWTAASVNPLAPAMPGPAEKKRKQRDRGALDGAVVGDRAVSQRHQQLLLAMAFARNPFPPHGDIVELARVTGMSEVAVDSWLTARRSLKAKLQEKIDKQRNRNVAPVAVRPPPPQAPPPQQAPQPQGPPPMLMGFPPSTPQVLGWQLATPPETPLPISSSAGGYPAPATYSSAPLCDQQPPQPPPMPAVYTAGSTTPQYR